MWRPHWFSFWIRSFSPRIVNFADDTNDYDKDITNYVDDIYDYDKVYYGKFITNVDDSELKTTFLRPLLPPRKPGGGRIPVG